MRIARYGKTRYWAVYASDGALICITVYRKGAAEVVRRLQQVFETTLQRHETHVTKEVQVQR